MYVLIFGFWFLISPVLPCIRVENKQKTEIQRVEREVERSAICAQHEVQTLRIDLRKIQFDFPKTAIPGPSLLWLSD